MASESRTSANRPTAVPLGSNVVLVASKGPAPTYGANAAVPGVVGRAQAEALEALQQLGLNAQVFTQSSQEYPSGVVVAQWPRAGELAASGSTAALLVSTGPAVEGTALTGVPTVVGESEAEARATLERVGLHSAVLGVNSPTVPEGIVLGQLPEERVAAPAAPAAKSKTGLWVAVIAVVLLAVVAGIWLAGRGGSAETVTVPEVVGLTQPEAEQALSDAGLEIGTVTESPSTTATVGDVMAQDPAEGDEVDQGSEVDLVVAVPSDLVEVPDVVGMSKDEALQALARAQMQVAVTEAPSDDIAAGDVVSQSPKAGQQVPVDTEVGIVVSTGQGNVSVPNVAGLPVAEAEQELKDIGLTPEPVDAYDATVPADMVISQSPPSGASVAPGTPIVLLVSQGPAPAGAETVEVPNVVGKALSDATTALTGAGLKVVSFAMDGSGKPADQVLYQTPAAGESAPRDSQVALVVSSGK